jgi:predicted enzyme related to lactoylglutathione lyase
MRSAGSRSLLRILAVHRKFYETIFDLRTYRPMDLQNIKMRMFPLDDMMGVGGAVVDSGGFHKPSATDGPLIYLNGNPGRPECIR